MGCRGTGIHQRQRILLLLFLFSPQALSLRQENEFNFVAHLLSHHHYSTTCNMIQRKCWQVSIAILLIELLQELALLWTIWDINVQILATHHCNCNAPPNNMIVMIVVRCSESFVERVLPKKI